MIAHMGDHRYSVSPTQDILVHLFQVSNLILLDNLSLLRFNKSQDPKQRSPISVGVSSNIPLIPIGQNLARRI